MQEIRDSFFDNFITFLPVHSNCRYDTLMERRNPAIKTTK